MSLDGRDFMELRDVLTALRIAWWLPVLGSVVGAAAALVAVLLQTPLYTASTQLFVSTTNSSSTADVFQGSQFSQQRVTSYAELIGGEELAARVIDRLDLELSPTELSNEIAASASAETVLIDVTVTDPSPERAQRIAEAVGTEFTSFAADLETTAATDASPVKVTVTDRPGLPSEPSSPNTVRNLAFGLLAGLLAGAALAVLRARLDRSVKDRDEASELAGAPVIGLVVRDEALNKEHTFTHGMNRTAEDYRQLRTNLQFLSVDEPPKVIMVSSTLPSEGKTTLAINLSLALAEAGRRVVLIEADLRRPMVTRYLHLVGGVGLTNTLAGTADFDEVVQEYGAPSFSVLAAGPTPPNPGELLASAHMSGLLEKLRATFDYVIVDSPPLLPVADASGLAPAVDGVLLSVRYGTTHKDQLRQAAMTLERVQARLLGLVLNIVPPKAEVASAYGYGYSYDAGSK